MFELELSWVTEATKGRHERVPAEVFEAAEKFAKESLEEDSDDSGDEM
jgi:20S proteasome subunit alpha 7